MRNHIVGQERHPEPERRASVLIVDDTPANIQILAMGLRQHYDIRVATSGQDALASLKQEPRPDLILMDVMMPGMDGYELCRRIKEDSATWNIPLIFVTAKADVADQQKGFNLGAVDYISKPFEMPLVLARVGVHVRLKRKSERLEQLTLLDALTDIPNRRALQEALVRECGRAMRQKQGLAIIMLDIDHFKAFNDRYGHGAGDDCLIRVARALQAAIHRPADLLARYGGEEFCVVLPECSESGALHVAETLREAILALAIPHAGAPGTGIVTASIGYAHFEAPETDCSQMLLRHADQALYAAKARGRNQIVAWQSNLGTEPASLG